jgi:hypothetical protein
MRLRPAATALVLVFALAGCAPAPSALTQSPSPSSSPSATPTSAPEPVAMPTDCLTIVDPDVYAASFADMPLNDPTIAAYYPLGALTPSEPAAGATVEEAIDSGVELRCLWRDRNADVTFLEVEIGTVDPVLAAGYLDGLPAVGYDCGDTFDGRQCQIVGQSEMYPVEEATTVFLRDDVFISVEQANFPTNDLLAAIVERIWV